MKKYFICLIVVFLWCGQAFALLDYMATAIRNSAASDSDVYVIALLSSGYGSTTEQKAAGVAALDAIDTGIFAVDWYNTNASKFKVYRIDVESPTHGTVLTWTELTDVLTDWGINYDFLAIRHNSPATGDWHEYNDSGEGSSSWYLTVKEVWDDHNTLPRTVPHEMAHSIGGRVAGSLFTIGDSYWHPDRECYYQSRWQLNTHDRPSNEKWITAIPEIGEPVEGANFCQEGLWRSGEDCIMYDTSSATTTLSPAVAHAMDLWIMKHAKHPGGTQLSTSVPTVGAITGVTKGGTHNVTLTISVTPTVNASGAAIERVEFYFGYYDVDNPTAHAGKYRTNTVHIATVPNGSGAYEWEFDSSLYADGDYVVEVVVYDTYWNAAINASDNNRTYFTFENHIELGIGCTTAFHIDRDCDGYGVGRDYVLGADADPEDPLVNTTKSITTVGGYASIQDFIENGRGYSCLRYAVVDKTNGNKSTGVISTTLATAEASPFQELDDANWLPGDCVLARGEPYQMEGYTRGYYASRSGTKENPIVYLSYPGELAKIITSNPGQGSWTTWDGWWITRIIGKNEIEGLTIRNCELDAGNTPTSIIYAFVVNDWTLEYNLTHKITGTYSTEHAWYLGNRGYNEEAIDCNGSIPMPMDNIIIRGNVFNTPRANDSFSYNGHISDVDGNGYGLLIEQNIFGPKYARGGLNLLMGVNDTIIRNNVFFGGSAGIKMGWYVQGFDTTYGTWEGAPAMICRYDMDNIQIYNNTFEVSDITYTGTHQPGQVGVHLYEEHFGIGPNPASPKRWPDVLEFTNGSLEYAVGDYVTQGDLSVYVQYAHVASGSWGTGDAAGYLSVYWPERLTFTDGSSEYAIGETITQGTKYATIVDVVVDSGSWANGDAAGNIYIEYMTRYGVFSAGEVGGDGTAVIYGTYVSVYGLSRYQDLGTFSAGAIGGDGAAVSVGAQRETSTWIQREFSNFNFFNNIFYGYGEILLGDANPGLFFRLSNSYLYECDSNTPKIYNNLVYRAADSELGYGSRGILLTSTLLKLESDGYFEDTCTSRWYGNTFADPLLVSVDSSYYNQPEMIDLRITDPLSPAWDGCGAGYPTYDIKGVLRTGNDCGAYLLSDESPVPPVPPRYIFGVTFKGNSVWR